MTAIISQTTFTQTAKEVQVLSRQAHFELNAFTRIDVQLGTAGDALFMPLSQGVYCMFEVRREECQSPILRIVPIDESSEASRRPLGRPLESGLIEVVENRTFLHIHRIGQSTRAEQGVTGEASQQACGQFFAHDMRSEDEVRSILEQDGVKLVEPLSSKLIVAQSDKKGFQLEVEDQEGRVRRVTDADLVALPLSSNSSKEKGINRPSSDDRVSHNRLVQRNQYTWEKLLRNTAESITEASLKQEAVRSEELYRSERIDHARIMNAHLTAIAV